MTSPLNTAHHSPRIRDRLLSIADVMEAVGLSRPTIYRLIKTDAFPRQFKPGGCSSRWSEAEIMQWRDEQRAA